MNYKESIKYVESIASFGIKLGLERISFMLDKLAHPEKEIHYVHVTGTNGKGSVVSMLSSISLASGLKTGTFISPHLVKWNERIKINGKEVSDEDFAWAITRVSEIVLEVTEKIDAPTQFEVITAAAFLIFQKEHVDIAILEVGMGGVFDSTNVITPICSVITNIGIDHTDKFGKTLEDIAVQKAGIIKATVPVVTGAESVALNILIDKAAPLNSALYVFRIDFTAISLSANPYEQTFLFRKGDFAETFTIRLGGEYQIANAALVVMTSLIMKEKISAITVDSIKQGFLNASWPGRFEIVEKDPIVILDGAHNINGAEALRSSLSKYFGHVPVCFVMGMMKDKDIKGIVEEIVSSEDYLFAVKADESERAAEPSDIIKYSCAKNYIVDDLGEAIEKAKKQAGKDGLVCICGSLYLIGEVKALWTNKE